MLFPLRLNIPEEVEDIPRLISERSERAVELK
jgi:hypothetical protein